MNTLGKLFLKGLAVVIPVALTLAILWWMAAGAERLMGSVLKFALPDGWYIPGMGLASGLALVALIGLLAGLALMRHDPLDVFVPEQLLHPGAVPRRGQLGVLVEEIRAPVDLLQVEAAAPNQVHSGPD